MAAERHVYVIMCKDEQCGRAVGDPRGGSVKRIANYEAHKAYQKETATPGSPHFINKISAGPMVEEDNKYMVGSCFLVEATRAEADAFIANDPFSKGGVWASVYISRYAPVGAGIKAYGASL